MYCEVAQSIHDWAAKLPAKNDLTSWQTAVINGMQVTCAPSSPVGAVAILTCSPLPSAVGTKAVTAS